MTPDDLEYGQWILIRDGVKRYRCAGGMEIEMETYPELKGQPLAVLAVELPFALVVAVSTSQARLIDTRECTLQKCSAAWVRAFEVHVLSTNER